MTPSRDDPLAARLSAVLDADVVRLARVGGGDVADARRVELADGRTLFAKTHRDPPPRFFHTEADGLRWMAEAGALAVADVVAVEESLLVLGWIDEGRPTAGTEPDLGRGLARLHRAGAPSFGREDRRTTGSRALPNDPCATWAEGYATNRLLPLARLAADGAALPSSAVARLESVAGRLDGVGAADERPARLHGDLWAGNRLVDTDGRSWLIDPAAHGGHREFDLAMMQLFGGFSPECFDAYDEEFPLAEGWRDRVPLHQLAPLAVHAIKFGGSYAAATERALDAAERVL
ncbi:fructosamine kinase family protein [Ilumatobacter sp.]|uniref:fructosamine kinase family protein n=1 Tax=Ilumatobacter sp. TaxID=1967498 RepID=UPI003B529E02